jgi:hypothetical protein
LTYHPEGADADNLISGFFQRVAETLPLGGLLIFDVIGQGQPSLGGRTWSSGDDWAVLVETTENHAERSLVRNIEVFRRVGDAYRRSHELHRVRLFDVSILCNQLASYGFATENVPVLWRSAAPYSAARFLCHTTGCNRLLTVPIRRAHLHGFPCRAVLGTYRQVGSNSKNGRTPEHSKAPKRLAA